MAVYGHVSAAHKHNNKSNILLSGLYWLYDCVCGVSPDSVHCGCTGQSVGSPDKGREPVTLQLRHYSSDLNVARNSGLKADKPVHLQPWSQLWFCTADCRTQHNILA
jgi:hypothetical protein